MAYTPMVEVRESYSEVNANKLPHLNPNSLEPSPNPSTQEVIEGTVTLSIEDKYRLYAPWRHFVIIKPLTKKFNHQYLKTKLKAS